MIAPQSVWAGTVQMDVQKGKITTNLKTACEGIRRLGNQGVELAVLPEMWPCGFDNPRMVEHAKHTPEILDTLSELAQAAGMIIAGSMPENLDGHIYNTLYLIDQNGSVAGSYKKIHLFEPTGEKQYFRPGDKIQVCQTSAGPIGLMTCYDLRFPELCRSLALRGALMVIVSAQWPASRIDHWDTLLRARAIENQIFIVASNRCGQDGPLTFNGHSQIVSPRGKVLAQLNAAPDVAAALLDFEDVIATRRYFDCLMERVAEAYVL